MFNKPVIIKKVGSKFGNKVKTKFGSSVTIDHRSNFEYINAVFFDFSVDAEQACQFLGE